MKKAVMIHSVQFIYIFDKKYLQLI
jgi:hypothetical protein